MVTEGPKPLILSVRGFTPKVGPDCYISPNATLIGAVELGASCSVWFNVVIRGDVEPVTVGEESNIQDGSIIHGTFGKAATHLGARVTVGHGVILHGTQIGSQSLIGMGSVLMDGSRIGENCLVGAGSLVTEGSEFPPGSLIIGRPAKRVRSLSPEELSRLKMSSDNYLLYKSWY